MKGVRKGQPVWRGAPEDRCTHHLRLVKQNAFVAEQAQLEGPGTSMRQRGPIMNRHEGRKGDCVLCLWETTCTKLLSLGMVRFGLVRFFKGFLRTQNRTIGLVHRL